MKMDEIIDTIKGLARSQGLYGRIYRDICELQEYDPEGYEHLKTTLEEQNFQTPLDLIMYIEC